MSCSFSFESYCKIMLHATKYSTNSVCGLLMGVADISNPSVCVITDSIPVCHYAPAGSILDMTADVMTKEVSSNNSSNARITIVGCYYCNGNASSDTIPPFFEKIVNTIKKQNGTCVQAVLKNSLLLAGANRDKNRLCITASRDSQEVQCTMNGLDTRASTTKQRTEVASCAQANALVTQLLQEVQGQQQQQKQQQQSLQYILIDTEDYLAGDCDTDRAEQRDFRNYECNRMVERLVLLLQQQQQQ